MARPAVSVIIVSHKRQRDLERAISALAFQTLTNIEIIVVAEKPPLILPALEAPLRYIEYYDANISRARNLGLREANAPIVAFCDDDAVPDPFWLERLIEPFYEVKNLGAAGGFVRGRNGISYQWKGVGFYRNGEDFALPIDETIPYTVFEPQEHQFVKTVGTNCAFRKEKLFEIGGYDEGFHYYLDDTDINMRLQKAGYSTAIVPSAQIIHNYGESRGRKGNRVPQSLYNLGASTNLFLRKHCPDELQENLERFGQDQEARLQRYLYFGLMTPRQLRSLMRDLKNGLFTGTIRKSVTPLEPIKKMRLVPRQTRFLALNLLEIEPKPTTQILDFPVFVRRSNTNHATRIGFHRAGYWKITGGRFGRIERKGRIWRYRTPGGYRADLQRFLEPNFSAELEVSEK